MISGNLSDKLVTLTEILPPEMDSGGQPHKMVEDT